MKIRREITIKESGIDNEYGDYAIKNAIFTDTSSKYEITLGNQIGSVIVLFTYQPNDNVSTVVDDMLNEIKDHHVDYFMNPYFATRKAIENLEYTSEKDVEELVDYINRFKQNTTHS